MEKRYFELKREKRHEEDGKETSVGPPRGQLIALVVGMLGQVRRLPTAGAFIADVAVRVGLVLILMDLTGYSPPQGFPK